MVVLIISMKGSNCCKDRLVGHSSVSQCFIILRVILFSLYMYIPQLVASATCIHMDISLGVYSRSVLNVASKMSRLPTFM